MTSAPMPSRPDRFVAAARFVGDFGNPFYAEAVGDTVASTQPGLQRGRWRVEEPG